MLLKTRLIEEFSLFIEVFLFINSVYLDYNRIKKIKEEEYEYEIKLKQDVEYKDIIGVKDLWNIILKVKDEKVINGLMNIINQVVQENQIVDFLSEHLNQEEDGKKTQQLYKLLILFLIEMERNKIIDVKPHSSLLKNSIIRFPLEIKNVKKTEESSLDTKIIHKKSNLIKNHLMSKTFKRRHNVNIGEELSFLTDLSLSKLDESNQNNTESISNNDNSLNQKSVSSDSNSKKSLSLISENNSIIFDKKLTLDENEKIRNDVEFRRPNSLLADLIKLKNDVLVKEKLVKMREHFDLNNYLQKEQNKGLLISTLDKRKSFLNFLRFDEEKNHLEEINNRMADGLNEGDLSENMELSLFGQENISLSSISLDEINLLPKKIVDTGKLYNENVNMDDINKKVESNKYTSIARESIMNKNSGMGNTNLTTKEMQKFYKNLNYNLNKNIVIDLKPPRGRDEKILNRSHIFLNIEHQDEEDLKEIEKEKERIKNLSRMSLSVDTHNLQSQNIGTMNSLNRQK